MKKFSFIFLFLALPSLAMDCTIDLSISGPMEAHQAKVIEILNEKDYTIQNDPLPSSSPNLSWISLQSAGDMQFKKWQVIHLVTTSGMEIADAQIPITLFSNKENAVLRFLKTEVRPCKTP